MRSPKLPAAVPAPQAPTQASFLSRGTQGSGPRFIAAAPPITPVTGGTARTGRPSLLGQTI